MKFSAIIALGLFVFSSYPNSQKTNVPDQPKPNIVFILTDDQAWNLLGKDGRYPCRMYTMSKDFGKITVHKRPHSLPFIVEISVCILLNQIL